MAKKKQQTKTDLQAAQKLILHAQQSLRTICDQMIGPDHFDKIPKQIIHNMIQHRYQSIRMRAINGSVIEKSTIDHFNEIFLEQLLKVKVTSLIGTRLDLAATMRDGLLLSVTIESALSHGVTIPAVITSAFSPYFVTERFFLDLLYEILGVVYRMGIIISDWNNTVFLHNVNTLAVKNPDGRENVLTVDFAKPDLSSIKIGDKRRELIRVGWANHFGEIDYVYIRGKRTGLTNKDDWRKFEVYIQRHALIRLQERLNLLPGMVHEAIYRHFKTGDIRYFKKPGTSLIELKVMDKKVGYLACTLVEEKFIIRSFLFVTNDGTPEAKKIAEFTRLNMLDINYLGIDTLQGFASYKISEDPKLKAVFIEADLEELLELESLEKFIKFPTKEGSTEALLNYMLGLEHLNPVSDDTSPEENSDVELLGQHKETKAPM